MTTLRFRGDGHGDGTFRVLQMADVQDGPDVDPDTVALIEAAIREASAGAGSGPATTCAR